MSDPQHDNLDETFIEISPVSGDDTNEERIDEETVLSYVTANPRLWNLTNSILDKSYFDKRYHAVIDYVRDFDRKYNRLPGRMMIRMETGIVLPDVDDANDTKIQEAIIHKVEAFCRERATLRFFEDGYEIISETSPTSGDIARMIEEMKRISSITVEPDHGVEVHSEFDKVLGKIEMMEKAPTGFKFLDEALGGGVTLPSYNLVTASSGEGKSFFLANQAVNYAAMGHNVVFITLELSESIVVQRISSIITDIPIDEVLKRSDEVKRVLLERSERDGRIQVKKLPMRGTTIGDIRTFVYHLETETGMEWNHVIIDYFDPLYPSDRRIDRANLHIRDKEITNEIVDWIYDEERPRILWTASQQVKGAKEESRSRQSAVSGGVDKVNAADNVITLKRSDEDILAGRMWGYIDKGRHGGTGMKIPFRRTDSTQKIYCSLEDAEIFKKENTGDVRDRGQKNDESETLMKLKDRFQKTVMNGG